MDQNGHEYEFKTLNLDKTTQFSTHHHLNLRILAKYRSVGWVFGVYKAIELQEIWSLEPETLEDRYFKQWETKLGTGNNHLNNPKISLSHVRAHGIRVFTQTEG